MRIVPYWDLDENESVNCDECSWSGLVSDCSRELFEALMELECPECFRRLIRVDYPTTAQTSKAAKEGRPEAAAEALRRVRSEQRDSMNLRDPSLLPDLDGDNLALEWDFEEVAGAPTTILRHEGRVI